MQNNKIQQALNNTLSSLYVSDTEARMLMAQAKGGKKVKKKLSVAMVLLIMLISITVTTLAVISLQQYYEKTIEKEGNLGLIEGWKASDHIAFVDIMTEVGIKPNEDKLAQMHDITLSEKARGKIAWELIQEYYPARDGILTSVDVIAKEKGPVEDWSLEDKAWFSQMMLKYQPEEVGGVNLLPTKEDITKEQAIEIMYTYYEKEYGLKREQFDTDKMNISFSENTWNNGETSEKLKTWGMNLWLKDDPEPFGISILADGTIKQAKGPYVRDWRDDWYDTFMSDSFWTIDGMVKFKAEWEPRVATLIAQGETVDQDLQDLVKMPFDIPSSADVSVSVAEKVATNKVMGIRHLSKEDMKYYIVQKAFLSDYQGKTAYYFRFVLSKEGSLLPENVASMYAPVRLWIDSVSTDVIQIEE